MKINFDPECLDMELFFQMVERYHYKKRKKERKKKNGSRKCKRGT